MAFTLAEALVFFKGDDSQLSTDMDTAKGKVGSFASTATNLIGGAVAGAAVAAGAALVGIGTAAFNVSADTAKAAADIGASLGIPIEEANRFADVAREVYGNNFAESVGDAAEAVSLLAQQMGLTADDPALQTMTENAFRLRDVFGIDVNESIGAVKTLMDNFGISGEAAFDLITQANQKGLNASGDLLDSINEYSVQFASGGASAGEFFSLMESGFQSGVLGTDKAADAFKEFRVRIQDGSTLTSQSLNQLGLDSDAILAGLADGTLSTSDAFGMVLDALKKTDDATVKFQSGVGLLGTQYEDLGTNIGDALTLTTDWETTSKGAIDSLDTKYDTFGNAVEAIWRRLTTSLSPFTDKLLDLVNDVMPSIMGAFDTFDKNVGPIMDNVGGIIDRVVSYVQGIFSNLGTSIGENATGPLQYWQDWAATNLPMVQQIFETVVGAIQTLWGLFGDDIMRIVDNSFNTALTIIDTVLRTIGDLITLTLQLLTGDWEGAWNTLQGIVQRIWDTINTVIGNGIDNLRTVITSIDWAELGRNIIEGIGNGISSAAGKIADAAKDAAKDAYNAAKSWLGISSPSRKTEKEIGVPFAQGIGKGIESQLRGLTGNVNLGLHGLMGGIQQPALAGAGGFNIVVNVSGDNASYESGRAVGRGVLDELRKRGG